MSKKHWRLHLHNEYMAAFRRVVPDPDERYLLHEAIHKALGAIHTPTTQAQPVSQRKDRFTIKVKGYLIPFEVIGKSDLRLLPIAKF
ncbi:MAG: hypothetical protein K0U66_06320 [Gammaproteobacteria bacterium]|nr:hypothetical protein [Gammaproteobacteria bacterium]